MKRILVVAESYGPGFYTKGIVEGFRSQGVEAIVVEANVWGINEVKNKNRLKIRKHQNDAKILERLRDHRYDAFFIAKGDAIGDKVLEELKKRDILSIIWLIDDPMWFEKVSLKFAPKYDMVYTTEKNTIELYKEHNIEARWLPFGYDENCLGKKNKTYRLWNDGRFEGYKHYEPTNVVFVGDPLYQYPKAMRYEFCSKLRNKVPVKFMGCDHKNVKMGDWWDGRVDLEDIKIIAENSKINLAFADQAQGRLGMKMRHTEIPGYGGFMLAQNFDYLNELYEIGDQIDTFDTLDECVDKIKYYSQHDVKRKRISNRGHLRAKKTHTYSVRAKQLINDIDEKIS